MLELRRDFGVGMITALLRIEGQPFGLIANNPTHLAAPSTRRRGDKAARFLQLCDAFDIPIVSLCDTPGFMVGPEAEKTALVRHVCAHVRHRRQPHRAAVRRRAAQGLRPRRAGDGRRQLPRAVLHRRVADRRVRRHGPEGRGAARLSARSSKRSRPGRARATGIKAKVAEIYDGRQGDLRSPRCWRSTRSSIPRRRRRWIMSGLRSVPKPAARTEKKRPCIDAW